MIAKFSDIDGKVFVNNVEITDSESWKKVIDSITELQQENEGLNQKYLNAVSDYEQEKFNVEKLKKQLQIKDYDFNVVNEEFRECAEENLKLLNRQLKFIKYLKDEIKIGVFPKCVYNTILSKYKEIIGENNE